jgi:hypothetical protein
MKINESEGFMLEQEDDLHSYLLSSIFISILTDINLIFVL